MGCSAILKVAIYILQTKVTEQQYKAPCSFSRDCRETPHDDMALEADRKEEMYRYLSHRATAETKELRERLPHTDPESPAVPHWAAFRPSLSNVSS